MKRAIFAGVAIICAISLSACGKSDEISYIQETNNNISEDSQPDDSTEELQASELAEVEEETSMSSESDETELAQIQLQVYIQPDMPEPFIEVFMQFEEFLNVAVQNQGFENIEEKMNWTDIEWVYMFEEFCGGWLWRAEYDMEKTEEGYLRYSLTDLTGNGFPELIMGRYYDKDDRTSPRVVFYYNETEGTKMIYATSYYVMALYEGGIIEFISGGVTPTETYSQFQEETGNWQDIACVIVDWDSKTNSARGYYWGDDLGDLTNNRPMSEDEYQKIIAQYATESVELEWTQFVFHSESAD